MSGTGKLREWKVITVENQVEARTRIVIWGTGNIAVRFVKKMNHKAFEIRFFVDSDKARQGRTFCNWKIEAPEFLKGRENDYDLLIICLGGWQEVYRQAVDKLHIPAVKIDNAYLFQKYELLHHYNTQETSPNDEEREILDYLESHPLGVFNYCFAKAYRESEIEVLRDKSNGLYYIMFRGKRMYMSRRFEQEYQVRMYCNQLFTEQDPDSPHCYLGDSFQVMENAVVLDAGVAEGNFALSVIEKADKVYLAEPDKGWMEALSYTFQPYSGKVIYINKFLSHESGKDRITIDELAGGQNIDFIKMDIEGAELAALRGAKKTLSVHAPDLAVCVYHNETDAGHISDFLSQQGYGVSFTKGYMVYIHGDNMDNPVARRLVKGIIRGTGGRRESRGANEI